MRVPERWQRREGLWLLTLFSAVGLLSCTPAPVYDLRVEVAPAPVRSDGLVRLGYELQVGGAFEGSRVERIEVLGDDGRVLVEMSAEVLSGLIVHPDRPRAEVRDATELTSGQRAMIPLWVTMPEGVLPPLALRHRVSFRRPDGVVENTTSEAIGLHADPVVLAAPLRAGLWLAHEGPGNPRSHHWAPLVTNGRVRIPQRFAIDLIGVSAAGRAVRASGSVTKNQDWIGYDSEVLAVADGIVRDARDDEPDRPALIALPTAAPSIDAVAGNYVLLELGQGRYVLYAHLRPTSVTVRAGDRVRRGQVLGRVGGSGNSNAPHLHFQMSDAVALEAAEGLPYVFEAFDMFGETSIDRVLGGEPGLSTPRAVVSRRLRELPLDGWVVEFR